MGKTFHEWVGKELNTVLINLGWVGTRHGGDSMLLSAVTLLYPEKLQCLLLESIWNVIAHGDARELKWRGNCRMEWVACTLHTTSEHGVSSITTADAHTSAASNQLNWRPRRFKCTRPFRRKTTTGFCAYAITFHTQSSCIKAFVSLCGAAAQRGPWPLHSWGF